MTSDRMMQVIGRLERAISRIETASEKAAALVRAQAGEIARLREERDRPAAPDDDPVMDGASHDKALAALRQLDALIDDIRRARADG